jgi:hypothetical protein
MPYSAPFALLLLATLGVAACTTLTVEERTAACQATDWATYGQNDGTLGVATGDRTKKFAECAEIGYPADIAAYQAGRAEGLKTYCTVENGYEVGYAGRRYRKVCPAELEPAFLQGYELGRKEQPVRYSPYFGFGYGFGYYNYPYFGYGFGHRHHGHRRSRRGSQK